jgi:hypothetical protein
MSRPAPVILRRSSPLSRPSPPGSLRLALTTAAVRHLIASGGNGPKERLTHNKDQQAGKTESPPNPGRCKVQDNLERIIPALEAIPAGEELDDDQN